MPWTPSKPADNEKIRNLGAVIRPNWAAIEQGEVPYDYLQLQEQGANPTRADNTGWLYSKEFDSQTELFYEDDRNPALVTQLTSNGKLGGSSTNIIFDTLSHDGTFTFNESNFISAWAYFTASSAANLAPSSGVNITNRARSSTGIYTVTTSASFANANVCVLVQPFTGSDNPQAINITAVPTIAGNIISIPIDLRNRDGNHADRAFYIALIGGL
jgi:hypothetical protein